MAVYAPHKNFALAATTLSLPSSGVGYYIYAKIPLDPAITTAEVITSTEHLWARQLVTYNATTRVPEGYILYKLGYISAVGSDGKRTLTSLWTSVKGTGEQLNLPKINYATLILVAGTNTINFATGYSNTDYTFTYNAYIQPGENARVYVITKNTGSIVVRATYACTIEYQAIGN